MAAGVPDGERVGIAIVATSQQQARVTHRFMSADPPRQGSRLSRPLLASVPERDRLRRILLAGMVLAEQDDEWQDGRRYFRPESMALIDATPEQDEEVVPALLMAS